MKLGWMEILVIVVLVVILFGHNKIPGMMKNLAEGLNVFKKEMQKQSANQDVKKTSVEKKQTVKKTAAKKVANKTVKPGAKKLKK